MFKCTVCQKIHTTQVEYCDCGNDNFEKVTETPLSLSPQNANLVPNILSGAIFASCILLSAYVIFFTGPKGVKKIPEPVVQELENQTAEIPSIDSIWDSSLPISVTDGGGSNIHIYKQALQNALYSNLETKKVDESGECEIEFRITKDGKLTNRKMYKKEGGKIFNNIVLNMLKATSEYKVPPENYTGEKFKAYVYTDNGTIKLFVK